MERTDRYHIYSRRVSGLLLADTAFFILFLFTGGWVEILLGVAALLLGIAGLALQVLTRELLRQRSLWLSCGFFGVIICTLVSMILNYP